MQGREAGEGEGGAYPPPTLPQFPVFKISRSQSARTPLDGWGLRLSTYNLPLKITLRGHCFPSLLGKHFILNVKDQNWTVA